VHDACPLRISLTLPLTEVKAYSIMRGLFVLTHKKIDSRLPREHVSTSYIKEELSPVATRDCLSYIFFTHTIPMCSPHVPPTPYSRAHVIVLNRLASFSRRTSVRSRCFAVQTPLLDRPADAIVLPVPIGASLPCPRPALVSAACLHARPEAFGEVFMHDQHLCARRSPRTEDAMPAISLRAQCEPSVEVAINRGPQPGKC
jgi:hypothetical protein